MGCLNIEKLNLESLNIRLRTIYCYTKSFFSLEGQFIFTYKDMILPFHIQANCDCVCVEYMRPVILWSSCDS